ncbi:histidine phosphatase family protein [Providencia sp. PROV255]|uniref:histidine phosphatase family protein n=1 Tax=Providencia sp. PROV255 TaxID=2949943 RepID=UPI003FA6CACE
MRSQLNFPKSFYPSSDSVASTEYLEFKKHLKITLLDVLSKHKKVMIFTHGGVIKTIFRIYCGTDSVCCVIDNCSITQYQDSESGWLLSKVNSKC